MLSGKWFSYGEMGCDIPERTFLSMVEKVKELSPDFVTWTGDIVPHDVWMQSYDHAIKYQKYLSDIMTTEFEMPVYGIMGNHDHEFMNS